MLKEKLIIIKTTNPTTEIVLYCCSFFMPYYPHYYSGYDRMHTKILNLLAERLKILESTRCLKGNEILVSTSKSRIRERALAVRRSLRWGTESLSGISRPQVSKPYFVQVELKTRLHHVWARVQRVCPSALR